MGQLITGGDTIREAAVCTLVNLAKLFTPGVKLTLIARHQSDGAAFMIFSEDQLEKVIETIQRHIKEKRATDALKLPANGKPFLDV